MGRGTVELLEANIERDASGITAIARVAGLPRRKKRYDRDAWDTKAGRAKIRTWLADTVQEMKEELAAFGTPTTTKRGTLTADMIDRYFPQMNSTSSTASDKSHARAWLAVKIPPDRRPLGDWPRDEIKTEHINRVITAWQDGDVDADGEPLIRKIRVTPYTRGPRVGATGTAAAAARPAKPVEAYVRAAPVTSGRVVPTRTIRHRCRVLRDLWITLDGTDKNPEPPTPLDRAKIPTVPTGGAPKWTPTEILRTVLTNLQKSPWPKTYARYAVHCTTSARPAQIGRALPEDLDLEAGFWTMRDCKGAPAHTIELESDDIQAWRAFIAADAWGKPTKKHPSGFDTSEYGKHIHACGLPPTMRPYHARHSAARAAILAGAPWAKLQQRLGHSTLETTRRSYTGFIRDSKREVGKALNGRFTGVFGPRAVEKKKARRK